MKGRKRKITMAVLLLLLAINLTSCALITLIKKNDATPGNSPFMQKISFDPYSVGMCLEDVNTDHAKYVADIDEFYTHFDSCVAKKHRSIFVRSSSQDSFSSLDCLDEYGLKGCYRTIYSTNSGSYFAIYELEYYPGDSVVYAYLNNDRSLLSQKELELYRFAVDFVNNRLDSKMSDYDKEIIIHDYICETLGYQKEADNDADKYNITGAYCLTTGFANCQGYTDAFYMLTNMAGIRCQKVSGEAQGTAHTWNVVNIDGRWSYIDVTFDDTAFDSDGAVFYAYCNVPEEYLVKSHIFADNQTLFPTAGYEDFYYTRKGNAVFSKEDFRQIVYLPISEGATRVEAFILIKEIQPLLDTLKNLNKSMQLSYFEINECTLLDVTVQ